MSKPENTNNKDKIFIYTEGRCTELKEHGQLNTHILTSNFQLTQQIDTLVTMFMNLADTVNKNALYMHRLGIEKDLIPARVSLDSYLKASSNVYKGLADEYIKNKDSQAQIGKLVRLGSDDEEKAFHNNILLKENILKTLLEKQEDQAAIIKSHEERIKYLEVGHDNLKMKVDFATEIPKHANNTDPTQLATLEKQYKNLESKLKKCSSNENLSEEIERMEKYLAEKIERVDKKVNELTVNFDDFAKDQRKKFEKFDVKDMREDLNRLESQMQDFKSRTDSDFKSMQASVAEQNSRLTKKIQGLLQDLSNKTISDGMGNKESKPFNTIEFMLNELTGRVNDIESDFSKRLITIDNQLKEFDDISKINKMISKMNLELNNKLNKEVFETTLGLVLHKNDFYDFVNKNLIKKDKLNTFKYEITEFKEYINNNLKELDNYTKKLKNTFDSGMEDLEIKINRFSNDMHKGDELVSTLNNKVKAIEKDLESLSKKHKELKEWIVDQFQTRLNSLATSTGIRCLSCGEKDVNYPPIQKHSMGSDGQLYHYQDDKYIYMNGVREQLRNPNENIQLNSIPEKPISANKSTGFRLLSATTNNTKTNRLSSAKPVFTESEVKTPYTLGQKVFNRQQIVHEHKVKQHAPVDMTIALQPKFRNRPFSSITVKHTFKN